MNWVVIVAGGKGLRMGSDLPKQFLPLAGKPVLMHTLEAFSKAAPAAGIVLVLPADQQAYWNDLCLQFRLEVPHRVTTGGSSRFDSVRNGLALIEGDGLVAVHDGVRPLVSAVLVQRCFEAAAEHGAVVPVMEVTESLRLVQGDSSRAVDRSAYRVVQTPQTFRLDMLRKAYEQPFRDTFTDDASVVEAAGFAVVLVEGTRENIKITTPSDLLLAEAWLAQNR